MRGEFIAVWADTWREIWLPMIEEEGVPNDIFCELYRELAPAFRAPSEEEALDYAIKDAILSRQAFNKAVFLAGIEIDMVRCDEVYGQATIATSDATKHRSALELGVASIVGDVHKAQDLLAQALRETTANPNARVEARYRALEIIFNDKQRSRDAFEHTVATDLAGERVVVSYLERIHRSLDDLAGDKISNHYFNLLTGFIEKFSLRYDLRRPCQLCPTLPGVFSGLMLELRAATTNDAHLSMLMKEFDGAIRDLRTDVTESRLKICFQKQINLIEALGRRCPNVTKNTLGQICDEVGSWPHLQLMEAMKNVYRFTNKYPGIRHSGDPETAIRTIDMRDLVAVSILLSGFTPYLAHEIRPDVVYHGA